MRISEILFWITNPSKVIILTLNWICLRPHRVTYLQSSQAPMQRISCSSVSGTGSDRKIRPLFQPRPMLELN